MEKPYERNIKYMKNVLLETRPKEDHPIKYVYTPSKVWAELW